MDGSNRVAWREGMFLRPQHFQAQDRYIEAQIRARVGSVRPWAWGFTRLSINEDSASLGKFAIKHASGVMPDGTPFSINATDDDDALLPEPLEIPDDTRDAIVYLTLPMRQQGAVEFREEGGRTLDARFLVAESEETDSFSEDHAAERIELGRPNLRLGVTHDQIDGRIRLGIARVREVNRKQLMFDDRFIPPSLDIRASVRLAGALEAISGRARQRADELAVYAVEASENASETFLILMTLNRWIPVLHHLQTLPMVHPERLYEAFIAMSGELSTLIRKDRKAGLPEPYDHENPQLCFGKAIDTLQNLLVAPFDTAVVRLELEDRGLGRYRAGIVDRELFDTGSVFLGVSSLLPAEETRRKFPSLAKLGPNTKMNAITQGAVLGVPLRHVPTPPGAIRPRPGFVYFELDRSAPIWTDFKNASALGLVISGDDWPGLKLDLMGVRA